MPALTPNIENRVRKLPKPSNATQGLQPLFEAVSNAMFAIEDRFGDDVAGGSVRIAVTNLSDPDRISILVADDGVGLDKERYEAFCEIDTDYKRAKGGKGGRDADQPFATAAHRTRRVILGGEGRDINEACAARC